MSKYEYKNYDYIKIKKNKNLEISCFKKNKYERYYKISLLVNITKTNLIKNILDIKKYPRATNKFIVDILKTEHKNVYAYKIYNELLKNLHKVDMECHFALKQIDENNFKFKNNRLTTNYFDDTYYIDINFIHIEIDSKNDTFNDNDVPVQQLSIYYNIDSSLCLFEFDNFWEEVEKIFINFGVLFGKK
jgi:hypothetical protein